MQGLATFGELSKRLSVTSPALLPEVTAHLVLALRRNGYADLPQPTKPAAAKKKVRACFR